MHGKVGKKYNCIFEILLRTIWNYWPPFKLLIKFVILGNPKFTMPLILSIYIYNLSSQRFNSNTAWFNCQTYIYIFSINLVSQVNLRSNGTYILYGCHLLRCLYNILYFLWLYDEIFIIRYNILKIAELDCCQIIILSIYVPSTHA